MFSTEEDKKASEDLWNTFPAFDIRVGMHRHDFAEGQLNRRQWQVHAPTKDKLWCTGCGITFIDAYKDLLKRLEEHDRL